MTETDRVVPALPPRLCILNELGEYFTAELTRSAVKPAWTVFRTHAYTYRDEAEAAEIALRFGGTVRPYDTPGGTESRGGVVLPFVRPGRR